MSDRFIAMRTCVETKPYEGFMATFELLGDAITWMWQETCTHAPARCRPEIKELQPDGAYCVVWPTNIYGLTAAERNTKRVR